MTTNNDTSSLLAAMKEANQSFKYDVMIPSLNRNVPFSEISTAQQKKLIKSIIDSEIYNTEFILCMYEIIRDNCGDDSVDVSALTILDKLVILIKMRIISVGEEIDISLPSKIDDDVNISATVNLDKLLKKVESKIQHISDEEYSISQYRVVCGIPSIEDEYKLENELRSHHEEISINNMQELRTNIGEKFIGELSKYIKTIYIPTETESIQVNLTDLSFNDRIQLVEQLPARCLDQALAYIKNVDELVQQVTLYKGTFVHKNKEKEKFEYNITLDSSFFINS